MKPMNKGQLTKMRRAQRLLQDAIHLTHEVADQRTDIELFDISQAAYDVLVDLDVYLVMDREHGIEVGLGSVR